ncbi:7-cyano-7-deazaguanine synthase QueC [Endozoicomonas sp. (ex Bugula neritina AB1)]|nr:7-cyano-7-deazaguanine synthase QueC [Endozoicomonas sp. (ex Bugula neritina AB1)]
MNDKRAVVLVSGGLDSATVLAIARKKNYKCFTMSFDYGQKHRSELAASEVVSNRLGAQVHKIIKLDLREIGGSALTDDGMDVPNFGGEGIPATYVPARNTVFLSLALGWAEVLGARDIFIGANNIDYSGYPDCRPEYLQAFQTMANLATKAGVEGDHFTIQAPLLEMTKAEVIREGNRLGVDYGITISCYQADDYGRACGECDSCHYRKKGFIEAGIEDPTHYQ